MVASRGIKYDDGISGQLSSLFTRDLATVDDQGIARAADTRRWGQSIAVAPWVDWRASSVTIAGGTPTILGTGYDSDGVTPLVLVKDPTAERLRLYRGYDLTLVKSLSYSGSPDFDILQGAVSGKQYNPRAASIYYGLIIILCERSEAGNTIGCTFVYTQDLGATLARVEVAAIDGGGSDIPPHAGGALPTTATIIREWCFRNAFPLSMGSTLGAWFVATDYVENASSPQGCQAFGFRATRANESSPYTLERVRLFYSDWSGGLSNRHGHGAVPCLNDNCVHIHFGDTGFLNEIISVPVDLANYETATLGTPITIHGGQTGNALEDAPSPQALSFVPGTTFGEYIGASDVDRSRIFKFSPDGSDAVTIRELSGGLRRDRDLWDALGMSWSPDGYVYGGKTETTTVGYCAVSKDGENWAEINVPTHDTGYALMLGNKLVWIDNVTREFYTADFPQITIVKPLTISPGGDNQIVGTVVQETAPATNNTRTPIVWAGTQWNAGGVAITPQPPPPPFLADTLAFRCTSNDLTTSWDFGRLWITDATNPLDEADQHVIMAWVCNLSRTQGADMTLRQGFNSGSDDFEASDHYLQWVPVCLYRAAEVGSPSIGRWRWWTWAATSSTHFTPNADFVIALDTLNIGTGALYSMPSESSGSHELEEIMNLATSAAWTAMLWFQCPFTVPLISTGTYPLFTLYESATDYVEVTFQPTSATAGNIIANFVVGGASLGTLTVAVDYQRGQVIQLGISNDGATQVLTARNSGRDPVTDTDTLAASVQPTSLRWSNNDQSNVWNINPIAVEIIDARYSDAEIRSYMQQPLSPLVEGDAAATLTAQPENHPIVAYAASGSTAKAFPYNQDDLVLPALTMTETPSSSGRFVLTDDDLAELPAGAYDVAIQVDGVHSLWVELWWTGSQKVRGYVETRDLEPPQHIFKFVSRAGNIAEFVNVLEIQAGESITAGFELKGSPLLPDGAVLKSMDDPTGLSGELSATKIGIDSTRAKVLVVASDEAASGDEQLVEVKIGNSLSDGVVKAVGRVRVVEAEA